MLFWVCTLVSLRPLTKRVMLHYTHLILIISYLSLFVFRGRALTGLHRYDNHLVGGAFKCCLGSFYGSRVINSQLTGQCERSLVNLVILLSHDSLHEGESMLDVRIEGRLLSPSLVILVPIVNGRLANAGGRMAEILCLIEGARSVFINKDGFLRALWCIPSGSEEWRFINSLEELGGSCVSRVEWALCDLGRGLHFLLGVAWGKAGLTLVTVHHLIVCLEAIRGCHLSCLKICRGILLRGIRCSVHLSHGVIVSHADLPIVLIVFTINRG